MAILKANLLAAMLFMPLLGQAGEIRLILDGKDISGKTIFVSLYNRAGGFPSRDDLAVRRCSVTATSGKAEIDISDIPPGSYAIAAFADLNGNGELDTNFIGAPKEPVGFSNGASARFGPPDFDDAVIDLGDGAHLENIRLK